VLWLIRYGHHQFLIVLARGKRWWVFVKGLDECRQRSVFLIVCAGAGISLMSRTNFNLLTINKAKGKQGMFWNGCFLFCIRIDYLAFGLWIFYIITVFSYFYRMPYWFQYVRKSRGIIVAYNRCFILYLGLFGFEQVGLEKHHYTDLWIHLFSPESFTGKWFSSCGAWGRFSGHGAMAWDKILSIKH